MDDHPISNQKEYQAALKEVSVYFDQEPLLNTPDGDRFGALLTLIEAYEA